MMTKEEYRNLCWYCSKPCNPIDSVVFPRPLGGVPSNPKKPKAHHTKCLIKDLLKLEDFRDRILDACKEEFE